VHAADQHDPRFTGRTVDVPKGLERALLMARQIVDGKSPDLPTDAAKIVTTLSQQALDIHVRLREIDRDLAVCLRGNNVASRLMTIPGIGPVGTTALDASMRGDSWPFAMSSVDGSRVASDKLMQRHWSGAVFCSAC
jgi:transposase